MIQSKTQELQKTTQNIELLRKEWLTPLSQTIEKINSNFSMYFSAMDCAGEVVLAQPENHVSYH